MSLDSLTTLPPFRYLRLFHILLYASVSARFAPLATPNGLSGLVQAGALTKREREALLDSGNAHNTVITWIIALQTAGIEDGRLGKEEDSLVARTLMTKVSVPIAILATGILAESQHLYFLVTPVTPS